MIGDRERMAVVAEGRGKVKSDVQTTIRVLRVEAPRPVTRQSQFVYRVAQV